jgi:hypothetical protein
MGKKGQLTKRVKFQEMMDSLHRSLEGVPDHRKGQNTRYEIRDAGLSAFSVFYMQSPSFLAYQRLMQQERGRNNARSLFGVEAIPSDNQIRNLLDPVAPRYLHSPFWDIYEMLQARGHLDRYRSVGNTWLCSLDGTGYFSSKKIHCEHCTTYEREDGTEYRHTVLAAVLVAPGNKQVIALEPEYIRPQDGHDKQDCEQAAIKRWVKRNAGRFADWQVTILTDDLHSHQPLCELLLEHRLHFIMTCKTESHSALYEEVRYLNKIEGAVPNMTVRRWNGRYHERRIYRWAEQVPLRADAKSLSVNWCEVTIFREDTGKQIYHNAWITSHPLTSDTVPEVVAAGRAHWKVENENFNVLKNQGYHFEHNYGHGKQHLSTLLLTLLLLAFLFHTVLQLSSSRYRAIREALGARRTFFNDLRALTRYLHFEDWDTFISFMGCQLELAPG